MRDSPRVASYRDPVPDISRITSYNVCYTKLLRENHPSDEFRLIFGDPATFRGTGVDLFHLAERLAASKAEPPKLFQCCGREDFLYEDNLRFRDHCRQLGLALTYEEEAGAHEWAYWDAKIQRVLEWLPLED